MKKLDELSNEDIKSIEAIVICSFTAVHKEQVEWGLKHKKAIFCEKPMASTYEDSLEIYKMS